MKAALLIFTVHLILLLSQCLPISWAYALSSTHKKHRHDRAHRCHQRDIEGTMSLELELIQADAGRSVIHLAPKSTLQLAELSAGEEPASPALKLEDYATLALGPSAAMTLTRVDMGTGSRIQLSAAANVQLRNDLLALDDFALLRMDSDATLQAEGRLGPDAPGGHQIHLLESCILHLEAAAGLSVSNSSLWLKPESKLLVGRGKRLRVSGGQSLELTSGAHLVLEESLTVRMSEGLCCELDGELTVSVAAEIHASLTNSYPIAQMRCFNCGSLRR